MIVPARIDKDKAGSKRIAQAFGLVPRDRQPSAPLPSSKQRSARWRRLTAKRSIDTAATARNVPTRVADGSRRNSGTVAPL